MWHDTRTMELVNNIIDKLGSKDYFRKKTGLPINTYFSASKFKWMMENVDEIREKFLNNDVDDLCFGTIDSWVNFVKLLYFLKRNVWMIYLTFWKISPNDDLPLKTNFLASIMVSY